MSIKGVAAVSLLCVALFLGLDFFLTRYFLVGSFVNTKNLNRWEYRIRHDTFHHTLKPNSQFEAWWGPRIYKVRTNSLGFVDQRPREVKKKAGRPRLVFMGDSFTEGTGGPWETSFVGKFAASLAQAGHDVEVLNAGVESYSPSVYFVKTKWLIDQGYVFDHVIVMLDISDILDEAWYSVQSGIVKSAGDANVATKTVEPRTRWMEIRDMLSFNLRLSLTLFRVVRELLPSESAAQRGYTREFDDVVDLCLSAWTYDRGNPSTEREYEMAHSGRFFESTRKCKRRDGALPVDADAPRHIDAAVTKAAQRMEDLHALLAASGIKLSVGVHPWPGQLQYDTVASRQVEIWKTWCKGRCTHFIDTFPDFFAQKQKLGKDWYRQLYIPGDFHFNELGNGIVAEKLLKVWTAK
jgi:hypothetical protein